MSLLDQIKEEPVLFQSVVQAGLAVVSGYNLIPGLTQDKMGLLLAFSASLLGFFTRRVVTPTSKPKNDAGTPLVPTQ
jgi:hypothetical protein